MTEHPVYQIVGRTEGSEDGQRADIHKEVRRRLLCIYYIFKLSLKIFLIKSDKLSLKLAQEFAFRLEFLILHQAKIVCELSKRSLDNFKSFKVFDFHCVKNIRVKQRSVSH